MRLVDVLDEKHILDDLKAMGKEDILLEIAAGISASEPSLEREKVLKALAGRERLGSTGIGYGVAIPHGKVTGLSEIMVFFARSRKGVDFESMDRLPVHLFFAIIVPENSASAHLKVLASLSHLLKNQEFRARLSDVPVSDIYRTIAEADRKNGKAIGL